jgi:hypothetical protein
MPAGPASAESAARGHGDAVGYCSVVEEKRASPEGPEQRAAGTVPMSEDERPGDEHGQDELIAAFAALGGRLTGEEFMRLLGSAEYYGRIVQLAGLLLAGDTAAADDLARGSLAALQQAPGTGRMTWTGPAAGREAAQRTAPRQAQATAGPAARAPA